jgi:hypothetical protein
MPQALEPPHDIACVLKKDVWPIESLENFEKGRQFLRFEAGGRPFAEIKLGSDAELVIPAGLGTAGGFLRLFANGVHVTGHIDALEIPLYPAVPFVMSGVFVPNHDRRLIWRSARPGFITVVTERIPRLMAAEGELSVERPCNDIGLGRAYFEDAAIDKLLETKARPAEDRPPWWWLRSGKISISTEPNGSPAAEIDVVEPRDDTMLIHPPRILSVKAGWTRIALRTYGGIVSGWIRSDRIEKSTKEYLDLSHDSFQLLLYQGRLDGHFIACDHEIPLVAEIGNERHVVGKVWPRAPLEAAPPKAGWSTVVFRDAGIVPADGASLLVREADLTGCSEAPPRKTEPKR